LILAAWIGAVFSSLWLPLQPDQIHLPFILKPPGSAVWFGFDDLGRPVFDRLLVGAKTSFIVSFSVVIVTAVIGVVVGAYSAWRDGWLDHVIVRVMDIVLAFPGILLAIALAGMLGPGLGNVIMALSCVGWVGFARLTRAQVLSLKHADHVSAALALGVSDTRIVFKHLLPLAMAPIIVEATFGVAGTVIAEAGLSFLGLGVQPPAASWGNMIRDGVRYMLIAPHMVVIPGLALCLVVLAVNLLGDRIRDILHVR